MSTKNRSKPYMNYPQVNEEPIKEIIESHTDEPVITEPSTDEPIETVDTPVVKEVAKKAQEEVLKPATVKPKTQSGDFAPVFKTELELNNYAEAMDKTKTINPEDGGAWQYSLFNTIKDILKNESQEVFNKEWNTVLNYFNKNKEGIFNENFIFRFPEQWPGSSSEFTMYRRIIYTIIQTADHKARKKALAEINLSMVVEGFTEAQKQKFFSFYGL